MAAPGDIHYARTRDGIDIAYTVFGEGPDLLIAPGFVTHLDLMWDLPPWQAILGFGRSFRVIVLDKRGTGLSDRSLGFGSLEDRAEDVRAVLEDAGSEQTVLYGISEGGPMCIYFAASHPERVRALVLHGTAAYFGQAPDGEAETTSPLLSDPEKFIDWLGNTWGQGRAYGLFLQNAPDEDAARRVLSRFERSACTPQMCREIMARNLGINALPFLGSISAPTLVVHCDGDPIVPIEYARVMADRIPNSVFAEVSGDFHASWLREDSRKTGLPIAEFLSRVLGQTEAGQTSVTSRELASVLFTDIVASTERAAEVGDSSWRSLIDEHDAAAGRIVGDTGGRLVKTTGDGVVATFSGPSSAVSAALALQDAALPLGVSVRAGLHTGEIERRGDDIGGMGVHIASRISSLAQPGEILVSRTARDLAVGSSLTFEDRGTHELKGVPESWQVYAVA
jgi:class 3 adenylate cyclase